MDYISTRDASTLWGISMRRVQVLCDKGKVEGAKKIADVWIIPKGTSKPVDGRTSNGRRKKQQDK